MPDRIFEAFLERQIREGAALAQGSDLLELVTIDPQHHVGIFKCSGLVQSPGGNVETASHFEAGIYFAPDHLRRLEPMNVITWFGPTNVWHPNIRPPHVCLGNMAPGVGLVELVYQLHEIITWRRFTAHHSLNWDAANWANRHRGRFPVDRRPLRRRELALTFRAREARV